MAKRFIDTNFYKSPFIRGLKGSLKGLYSFIICDCDGSGIWVKDLEIASVYVGFQFSETQFNDSFIKTGKAIDLKDGKYFFPDFIEHQYPKGFSAKNPAQINFILTLKKYKLIDENLQIIKDPKETHKRVLGNGIGNGIDIGLGKKVENENLKTELYPTFDDFWELYNKKVGKKDKIKKKWDALNQDTKEYIVNYIPEYLISQPNKKYRKNPETFLNNESWNDELISNIDEIPKKGLNSGEIIKRRHGLN